MNRLTKLTRSISVPIRDGITRAEMWEGEDRGLIWCWELGRIFMKEAQPNSQRAALGELPLGDWKGGVEKKLKSNKEKAGSLQYLAQWQGMRGEDLDIDFDSDVRLTCTLTGQTVVFSRTIADEEFDQS